MNKLILAITLVLFSVNIYAQTTRTTSNFDILKTHTRKGNQYYTQGLQFYDSDTLIESTGLYGESRIQHVQISTMKVLKSKSLGSAYFGEGATLHTTGGVERIYQMTWKEKKVFVWKANDLSSVKTLTLPSLIAEGWGMTQGPYTANGRTSTVFYITNGSANLYVVDPDTFKVLKTIPVKKSNGSNVKNLNELEWVNGRVWANVYHTNTIVVINPTTGRVETVIDLSRLATLAKTQARAMGLSIKSDYVLNGIAYDADSDRMIVTGKKWPLMWEIKVNNV